MKKVQVLSWVSFQCLCALFIFATLANLSLIYVRLLQQSRTSAPPLVWLATASSPICRTCFSFMQNRMLIVTVLGYYYYYSGYCRCRLRRTKGCATCKHNIAVMIMHLSTLDQRESVELEAVFITPHIFLLLEPFSWTKPSYQKGKEIVYKQIKSNDTDIRCINSYNECIFYFWCSF